MHFVMQKKLYFRQNEIKAILLTAKQQFKHCVRAGAQWLFQMALLLLFLIDIRNASAYEITCEPRLCLPSHDNTIAMVRYLHHREYREYMVGSRTTHTRTSSTRSSTALLTR